MAPKFKLTAAISQERYGDLVSAEYGHCVIAHTLRGALASRIPPVVVSDGVLKLWFAKHRLPDGAVRVSTAQELQEQCGSFIGVLAAQASGAYKLGRALMGCTPPVYASDGVLKEWLRRYFDCTPVNSAGHLELRYGDSIRTDLRVWLRTTLKVDASERTCETWRIREWSTAHRLLCIPHTLRRPLEIACDCSSIGAPSPRMLCRRWLRPCQKVNRLYILRIRLYCASGI